MVDGNDRTVAAADLPVAEPYPMALRAGLSSDLPAREEREVDEALARFQHAIDEEIADRLKGEGVLKERLARVRRTAPAPSQGARP